MENECIDPQACGPVTPIDPIDLTPAPDVEIRWDWESVCLSNDGGLTKVPGVAVYDMADPQNPVATLYIGSTDVTGTHTIVSCENADVEQVDDCFQDIADPSIKYKRVIFVDTADVNTVYATIWIDINGAIIAPPINVEACSQAVASVLPVCDVLTATVGGTIPYTLTGSNVAITYTPSLTLTNDTVLFYWTDFGDGYNDVGNAPSHTYTADGSYEIKSYVVTSSGNKILLAAKEIVITAGVVTIATANPQTVNRVYKVSVGSAMQEYSGTTPVGTPINPDGSAYTVQGTLAWSCPVVIDELEDNAAWTPVAPVTDCVDTFARTSCASSAPASVTIQGNINFTDVGGGINPGMTDAAPFLTTPADANALDGVSTQLNIPLTTIDALNFQDGEQYLYITSNGGVSSPMATQWVEATDPTGSTFATDLTNELISVLPSINVNAVPTVTITSVVSPILNYDLQFVYGPSADTVDTVNSTGNTHSIDANNQTQINWDFVLPFTPTISDTLVSVTFEYAGSQSSVMNADGAVIAGGLIGTNYGTLSNPAPYAFAPALGAGTVQTVSYSMTAAIDGITWADIATKFSGWAYMGQSENIQMLVDGMQVTVNYTTEGAPEDAYKTTGCNDDRRDGFLETLATTSLTTTNTLRSESHNYVQLDSFGNYTGNLVTETRTYNNDGSLNSVVYTDTVNGSVVSLNGSTTQLAPVTGSDFESIIMCDGTETFIRTIGYMPGGDITFTNDRLADGTAYVTVGPVTIGSCDTGSVGTTPVELCVVEQSTIALNLVPAVVGNVVTVTLDVTGTTTAITNEVVDFGDGSVSISPVHSYDYSLVADGSYIISARVVDSNGASLIQAVAVTVTGGVPVLGTLPAAKTTTYDVQVAKVFRSFDGSGTVLWTVDENGVAFTPGVGQTIVPCDSCGCNEKPCESFCFSSKPTNGTSVAPVTNLTKTVQRLAAPYVVVTNYSSATITSISADVTIDGVSIPAGFTWSVDSSTNQIFTDTVSITGTDYIVTEVR